MASVKVNIIGDSKSIERAFRRAGVAGKSFAGDIASVASKVRLAWVVIGGAAVVGSKQIIQAASDMNETVSKVGTVFGENAKDVEKWGDSLANSFGLSKQAGLDAAAIFGTFGGAAGLAGQDLVDFSEQLVQAAGDLASFHNVDVNQALQDLRSGLSGEVEPLRKYGILLNDATLRQQALSMGLVKTTKEVLPPNVKMLTAQAYILKHLGPALGDFARTSGSAANQQRILAAQAANLKAQLGQGLLPIYVKILQGLNKAVPAVRRFWDEFASASGSDRLSMIWNGIATAGDKVFDAFKSAFNSVDWGKLWQSVNFRVGQILSKIHTILQNADWGRIGGAIGHGMAQGLKLGADFAKKLGDQIVQALKEVDWHEANHEFWKGLLGDGPGDFFGNVIDKTVKVNKKFYGRAIQAGQTVADVWNNGFTGFIVDKTPKDLSDAIQTASALAAQGAKAGGGTAGQAFADAFSAAIFQVVTMVEQLFLSAISGLAGYGASVAAATAAAYDTPGGFASAAHNRSVPKPTAKPPRIPVPTPIPPPGGGGGTTDKDAWRKPIQKVLDRFDIALERAGWTKTLQDDLGVLKREEEYLKKQLMLHKGDVEIQKDLVSVQSKMRDLRQQERQLLKDTINDMRSAALPLFGGPVLAPSDADVKRRLGFPSGITAKSLTKDLLGSNQNFGDWVRNLRLLGRRGAPKAFISQLTDMGVSGASYVAALAHASKKDLSAFFQQFRIRENQIANAAKFAINANTVNITASKINGPQRPPDVVLTIDGKEVGRVTSKYGRRKGQRSGMQTRGRWRGYVSPGWG